MAAIVGPFTAAPAGSTGNNTHSAVQMNEGAHSIELVFNVESVGATPTVTFGIQGSLDGTNWDPVLSIPAGSDTAALTQAATAVGQTMLAVERSERFFSQYRLVTTSNTNVTYNAAFYASVGS